jgi:alkylation response protein AidB-like acyl-CoA dehydrogenase
LQFPERYGGQGKDAVYENIFKEEAGYSGAPLGPPYNVTVVLLGNLILKYGTEQQKKEYLPRIIKGEIISGPAFTEPEAGSDLASVQTRAIRQSECYIVNGQKMFTSFAHAQDGYLILMARTDPNAPLEKGISLFIMDNRTPGISYTPLITMGDIRTNQVFLDDVRIPVENLIGEENKGWDYFMQTKDYYWTKGGMYRLGSAQRMFDNIVQYVKETQNNGQPLSRNPLVRQKVTEMAIDIKACRLLYYRLAWMLSKGLDSLAFAALVKVFADDVCFKFSNSAMQILGLYGQLGRGSSYAPLSGIMEQIYPAKALHVFVDCGVLVVRNLIATHGLGLPEF